MRRLKDKLGTRGLASAEIDFDGARAWPIGPISEGFHVAVEELLDTSRWLNAVGSTGIMRRAYLEASSFARHRRAFGAPVALFPAVREQLALMKVEEHGALASTMALTALLARLDEGTGDEVATGAYRLLVNANKYVTSVSATEVARQGIEVLGGNGTIEDFSPLPRLYRDAMVFESWEGTHNVLCAQVRRDCGRHGVLEPTLAWLRAELAGASGAGAPTHHVEQISSALDALEARLRHSVDAARNEAGGGIGAAPQFRRLLDLLVRLVQAACLLAEAGHEGPGSEKEAVAALYLRRHVPAGNLPEDDPTWPHLIDAALAGDAG